MFKKLRNAVSSVFDGKEEGPKWRLPPDNVDYNNSSSSEWYVAVDSRSSPTRAPTLVACDVAVGVVASVAPGENLTITTRNGHRYSLPIRKDEEWTHIDFIAGTDGCLLLLSRRVLLQVQLTADALNGDDGGKSLFLFPTTRAEATCLSVFVGTTYCAVGTSNGSILFAKFADFSPADGKRCHDDGLRWCEFCADAYQFVDSELPAVVIRGVEGDKSSYEVRSCVQYSNDPNAFLAVVANIAGVVKFYILEKRLSAFFCVPVEEVASGECVLGPCAVTPGGGYVAAMDTKRFRIFVWNEQNNKRKDRTTPSHFVFDVPSSTTVRDLPSTRLPTLRLWLLQGSNSKIITAAFLNPLSLCDVCKVEVDCDTKQIVSFVEYALNRSTTLTSVTPCILTSPWSGSWLSSDLDVFFGCSPIEGVVMIRLDACSGNTDTFPLTRTVPIGKRCIKSVALALSDYNAVSLSNSEEGLWKGATYPPIASDVTRSLLTPFTASVRPETNRARLLFDAREGAVLCAIASQFDEIAVADDQTSVDDLIGIIPAALSCVWRQRRSSVQLSCPGVPSWHIVVFTCESREATSPDTICLAVAIVDTCRHQLISFNTSPVTFLPIEGPESPEQFDILQAEVLDGSLLPPTFCANDGYSVAVQLRDRSFRLLNCHPGVEPIVVPSVLFPANDIVVDFAVCYESVQLPTKFSSSSSPKLPPEVRKSLFLIALTSRRMVMVVDVLNTMSVVGLRSLINPDWKAVSTDLCSSSRRMLRSAALQPRQPCDGLTTVVGFHSPLPSRSLIVMPNQFHIEVSTTSLVSSRVSLYSLCGSGATPMLEIRLTITPIPAATAVAEEEAVVKSSWMLKGELFAATVANEGIQLALIHTGKIIEVTNDLASVVFHVRRVAKNGVMSIESMWSLMDCGLGAIEIDSSQRTSAPVLPLVDALVLRSCVATSGAAAVERPVDCCSVSSLPSGLEIVVFQASQGNGEKVNTTEPPSFNILFAQAGSSGIASFAAAATIESMLPQVHNTSNITLVPSRPLFYVERETILDWNIVDCPPGEPAKGPATTLPLIVVTSVEISSGPVAEHVNVRILDGLVWRSLLRKPYATRIPFPFCSRPQSEWSLQVEGLLELGEVHLLLVFIPASFSCVQDIEVVHLVLDVVNIDDDDDVEPSKSPVILSSSSLPSEPQTTLTWPSSRRPITAPAPPPLQLASLTHAQLLKRLPPPPSSTSAAQREQGFFKRLVTASFDSQQQKIEAVLQKVKEEKCEDILDRIIDSAERQNPELKRHNAEMDRRKLLGSKYDAKRSGRNGPSNEMNETKQVMNENLQLLQERGEKIDKVQTKSQLLADEAMQFSELCKKLKEKERSRWF